MKYPTPTPFLYLSKIPTPFLAPNLLYFNLYLAIKSRPPIIPPHLQNSNKSKITIGQLIAMFNVKKQIVYHIIEYNILF